MVWQMVKTFTLIIWSPEMGSSLVSSASVLMSPKIKRIFSSACCSLEEPWTELWRMSAAKRALRDSGDASFALFGSVGPIMALHSSTAFSLVRTSIIQGPLKQTFVGCLHAVMKMPQWVKGLSNCKAIMFGNMIANMQRQRNASGCWKVWITKYTRPAFQSGLVCCLWYNLEI